MTEYRISPELRRCCWWGIGGAVLSGCVFYWSAHVRHRDPIGIVIGCAMFLLVAVALTFALHWRVVVDSQGIARRRFGRWDRWTWEDFASGRIGKRHAYILVDPARAWWRRSLNLGYLDSDDIPTVMAAINARYRLPPPPGVPDSLTIKYGFFRRITLDRNGIQLLVRGTPHAYLWGEVGQVDITRMDPLRRDFKCVEIALPDHTIELDLVTTPYKGATAEEINEFLV
ncbi:MAG: hypothetical protein LLG00_12740, partial [Planctomycetaceae bacterium]|nr:hypothetical protein [Planctomycetaceae bacterium]